MVERGATGEFTMNWCGQSSAINTWSVSAVHWRWQHTTAMNTRAKKGRQEKSHTDSWCIERPRDWTQTSTRTIRRNHKSRWEGTGQGRPDSIFGWHRGQTETEVILTVPNGLEQNVDNSKNSKWWVTSQSGVTQHSRVQMAVRLLGQESWHDWSTATDMSVTVW